MVDFVKAAATAKRLIEASGRTVELFKLNRTPANSAQPWRGNTNQPHDSKGGANIRLTMAFVPASGSGFGKLIQENGGSLAVAFDQVGLVASDSLPAGFTPEDLEQADKVRDGSDVWRIVTRGHLRPATKSLLFVFGLKR